MNAAHQSTPEASATVASCQRSSRPSGTSTNAAKKHTAHAATAGTPRRLKDLRRGIDPSEVGKPEQRSDRQLDGRRKQSGERTEPRVREADREAHERNTGDGTLDDVAPADQGDLVERPRREKDRDHDDAEGRRREETISSQRFPEERG